MYQVLPDWLREKPTGSRKEVTSSACDATSSKMTEFMATMTSMEKERRAKAHADTGKAGRVANMFFLQGADHMLHSGIGITLARFVVEKPVKPLLPQERRYFVPAEALGTAGLRADDPPGRQRACIEDKRTGSTRLELPIKLTATGTMDRPCIHVVTDEGPIGSPAVYWFFSRCNARGTKSLDPWHKCWRNAGDACRKSGLWVVVLEYTIIMNCLRGPWGKDGFYATFKAAANHYLATSGPSCPLFQHFYDQICWEWDEIGLEFGTPEHMERIFKKLAGCRVLHRKGDHVRLGRWFSWFRNLEERSGDFSAMLLFLVYTGIREGFWTSIYDSPLVEPCTHASSGPEGQQPEQEVGAIPSSSAAPTSVKGSNAEVAEVRKKCRNTLELAVRILANHLRFRCARLIQSVFKPVVSSFGIWQTAFKTQLGTLSTVLGWAAGTSQSAVMFEVWQTLEDGAALSRCGFLPGLDRGMLQGAVMDEESIAASMLTLIVNVVGMRLSAMSHYCMNLPYLFVLLLSPETEVREACLQKLQAIWQWLEKAEERAWSEAGVKKVLDELEWPRWVWVREIFIMLSEFSFQHVPHDVRNSVRGFATGLLNSEMNESAFNELRTHEGHAPNKKLGCAAAWSALQRCGLANDHDRGGLAITEAAKLQAARVKGPLPETLFGCDVQDCSFGMEKLEDLRMGSYVSPSASRWSMIPACLQCCLALEWAQVSDAWMTLLLDAGAVAIHRSAPKQAFIVCWVCKWGAILWPMEQWSYGAFSYLKPAPPTSESPVPWKYVQVVNLLDWRVAPAKAVPPCKLPEGIGFRAVRCTMDGAAQRLLKFAAKTCFTNCQISHLKLLLQLTGYEPPSARQAPKSEAELCKALVKQVLEDTSDEEVARILARRFTPAKLESVLLDEDVQEELDRLISKEDEQDFQEVRKQRKPRQPRGADAKAQGSEDTSAAQPPASSAGPARSAGQTVLAKPKVASRVALAEARQYLPQVRGCDPGLDTTRHFRWQLSYATKPQPPHSVSKVFGTECRPEAMRAAFLHCLRVVWSWHFELTGESCPWELQP